MASTGSANSFGAKGTLDVAGASYEVFRLSAVEGAADLPYSLKVLLENLLRTEDGADITADHVRALAGWDPQAEPDTEIQYTPARVLMQDFTGVPCVVDLAAMREAMADLGGDPKKINPLAPAELVIDHSVVADHFGSREALGLNGALEYERNRERYEFLKWGQTAFSDFSVVPPNTGIVHQVNLERLARVVFTRTRDGVTQAYPDTLVGTDSHTTMINGLGVLGWGVGGIEAEAAMLGQPVSMLIPRVVGFKLVGALPAGATATDLVLTVTELLRATGVVGKFVEFYGPGVANVPLADRATIGNMSPEYGSTCAIFPIDDETLAYLRLTGRPTELVQLVEAYAKEQGMWHDPSAEPRFSQTVELDLSTVVPSLAGPKRPQDRVPLDRAKAMFRTSLQDYASTVPVERDRRPGVPPAAPAAVGTGLDESSAESFPASDPVAQDGDRPEDKPVSVNVGDVSQRPSNPVPTTLSGGERVELDHGAVAIAAITSCTNTSNPYVMVAAGLLAKAAVEKGLSSKPWVKTTLAPGSKVVTDYYEASGLTAYLDKLGFQTVGYGCTTCIGNSGPLPEEVSAAVDEGDLAVVSVLSGNRNFEGRINPDIKMNYLASPPLVVAYALAGTMDLDLTTEPLGTGSDGEPVYLTDIWPSPKEVSDIVGTAVTGDMYTASYADVFAGDDRWQAIEVPGGDAFAWDPESTYVRKPPYFEGMAPRASAADGHPRREGAGGARRLGHHRPHQPGRLDQGRLPGRPLPRRARCRPSRLQQLRQPPRQPRGDDPGHVRQHPAAQPAGPRHRGRRDEQGRRDHLDLRGLAGLPGRGHPAGRARRQGVRLRVLARLGRQGHRAARRARRHRRVLRAHPPLQPHRHGRAAAAVRRGSERRLAGPDRRRDLHDRGDRRRRPGAPRAHREGRRQDLHGPGADRHAR